MRIHNRHMGNDKSKDDQQYGNQKNGNPDFHPVREIPLAGWQVPVKGDQADIQAVEDNTEHRPGSRPLDYFQIFLPDANGIEKTGQRHETQQLHQIPESVCGTQQVPVVALGNPHHLDNKVSGQNQ